MTQVWAEFVELPRQVVIDKSFEHLLIGKYLRIAKDPEGTLSFRQISHPSPASPSKIKWVKSKSEMPNYGFTPSVYWAQTKVFNQTAKPVSLLIEFAYPLVDDLQFYQLDNSSNHSWRLVKSLFLGDEKPFHERPFNHSNFIIPVEFQPYSTNTLFFRVETSGVTQFPIHIWKPESFYQADKSIFIIEALILGALLCIIFYNICIYYLILDKNHLLFVFANIFFLIFQFSLNGLSFQYLWPESMTLNRLSTIESLILMFCCVALFAINMLDLKQHILWLHNALERYAFFIFGLGCVTPFIPYSTAFQIMAAVSIPAFTALFFGAIYLAHKGSMEARVFCLSWSVGMIGIMSLGLDRLGFLPATPFNNYVAQAGALSASLVLTFALIGRMDQERKGKYMAKKSALQSERLARKTHEINNELRMTAAKAKSMAKQRIIDAQLESGKLKDEFLATISHELRTPMNGIHANLDLLSKNISDENDLEKVIIAKQSSVEMIKLIDSILDLAQLQSGSSITFDTIFSLTEIFNRIQPSYNINCQRKGLTLDIDSGDIGKVRFFGDKEKLISVIKRLLDNAVKFTQQGNITVLITKVVVDDEEDDTPTQPMVRQTLLIKVIDSGIGVSKEAITRIFEPFRQVDGSFTRAFGGLGIGLAICQKQVELLGGTLQYKAAENGGSEFFFTITLGRLEGLEAPRFADEFFSDVDVDPEHKLKVVVVEDNKINQMVLEKILLITQCEVHCCDNGLIAFEYLKDHHCDVIFMDCQMPVMNGFEATLEIRKIENHSKTPIIAVTANASDKIRQKCFDSGMDECLAKPINTDRIVKALAQHHYKTNAMIKASSRPFSEG